MKSPSVYLLQGYFYGKPAPQPALLPQAEGFAVETVLLDLVLYRLRFTFFWKKFTFRLSQIDDSLFNFHRTRSCKNV